MELNEAILHSLNGNAVLFTGSGFSVSATNIKGTPFKVASALAQALCKELEIEEDDDLEWASEKYIEEKGEKQLIEFLREEFTCGTVSEAQKTIAKVDWKRIYTTNYDDVLEQSIKLAGKQYNSITTIDKTEETLSRHDNIIMHINGYIKAINVQSLNNEFKLTKSSFINDDFKQSEWSLLLERDIKNCEAFIFIGYSMEYDLDVLRTIYSSREYKEKCIIITRDKATDREIEKLERYGTVYAIGTDEFAQQIADEDENYTPMKADDSRYYSFEVCTKEWDNTLDIKDYDITSLLFKGDINKKLVSDDNKYIINRYINDTVCELINSGNNYIIVHSHLGNGKTCMMELLSHKLLNLGEVYKLVDIDCFGKELERINSRNGKKIILIDNYNMYINDLEVIKIFKNKDLHFVFTSRTYINDNYRTRLADKIDIHINEFIELDMNKLEGTDLKNTFNYISKYNLWGKNERKYKTLKQKYNSQMNNIILGFFKSDAISRELKIAFEFIKEDNKVYELVVIAFINNIMSLNLLYTDILRINNSMKISNRVRDEKIREILVIDNNKIGVTSSVYSKYIIDNFVPQKFIVDILIKIFLNANFYTDNKKYYHMKRMLVSYSNLKELLPSDRYSINEEVIRFYENIKNTEFCKRNIFFWLQYAITSIELKRYDEAQIYFDNAYHYEKQFGLDRTCHIDSHYARLLLETLLVNDFEKSTFRNFAKAHDYIINNKNEEDNLHYPLRQLAYYYDIYIKFYQKFSNEEKVEFTHLMFQAKRKIDSHILYCEKNSREPHRTVKIAKKKINTVLKQIG